MNKLLILGIPILFSLNILGNTPEVSCNPQDIHNYFFELNSSMQSLEKKALNQKSIQAMRKLHEDMILLFLDKTGTACAYDQNTIQELQNDTANPKTTFCNLQFTIAPMIKRINQDNVCNLTTLKAIATTAATCPEGSKLMSVIHNELKNPSCKKEFAEYAKTLSASR